MNFFPKKTLTAIAVLGLTACASLGDTTPSKLTEEANSRAEALAKTPRVVAPVEPVLVSDKVFIPVVARKVSEYAWLRSKRVDINASSEPVPMPEILRTLSKQGLSITSELPLDRFMYAGFSLKNTDAETALRAIVTSVGLDYQVDDARKLIRITPIASKTWYLNLGNRRAQFSSGASTQLSGGRGGLGSDAGVAGGSGGSVAGGGNNLTAVSSSEDFWNSLRQELDSRLQLMLPDAPMRQAKASVPLPALAPPAGAGAGSGPNLMLPPIPTSSGTSTEGSDGLLKMSKKTVGTFSLNPETGAVTVQAPHWILEDLGVYFKRVQDMYNTDIKFQGELVLLTTSDRRSEGLDITSFARFAGDNYGLAYSNNGLGGVTLSRDALGISRFSANAPSLAGPMLGLVSSADSLAIFNAYLTNLGTVTTLQRPSLTTTSGVPADFRRVETRYFNSVSQQAAASSSGAAVSTQNTLVAQDFGTVLRVNPRIDLSTGLIRAQIELIQTTETGEQTIPQAVSSGSSVTTLNTKIPTLSKVVYSGEALLKDGDMIVMGGQTENADQTSRDGVTGLMDVPGLNGIFGKDTKTKRNNIFYFALKVSVTKR